MKSLSSEKPSPEDTSARRREEELSLAGAVRRLEAQNARREAGVSDVQAQNEALQVLIREQEEYLAEVEVQIARMEEHRRAWRWRYTELTGRALEDPVPGQRQQ